MTTSQIDSIFSADGPLASVLSNYVPRAQQLQMAKAIESACIGVQSRLAIEAETGTGKSVAYLLGAILSGKKILLSTATKALQDQLFTKDIPLVQKVLKSLGLKVPSAILMKGRANYLCLHKAEFFEMTGDLLNPKHNQLLDYIGRWMYETKTGDATELEELSEDNPLWGELNARADACLGQECEFFQPCFVTSLRKKAVDADIIVVNHALLCADRALRLRSAQIIPDTDVWIIDEAHALEDMAARHFGVSISLHRLMLLHRDLTRAIHTHASNDRMLLQLSLNEFLSSSESLFANAPIKSPILHEPDQYASLKHATRSIDLFLGQAIADGSTDKAVLQLLHKRVETVSLELDFCLSNAASESGYITYFEQDGKSKTLNCAPVNIGPVLAKTLWSTSASVVLTSATLAIKGKLDHFVTRTGLPADTQTLCFPGIFDYKNRAAIYVPAHLPEPTQDNFLESFAKETLELIDLSQGGAFVLCTSYRALNYCHAALAPKLAARKILALKQGDLPKMTLLERFKAATNEEPAVLFATHSFWEGVDVRGEGLRLVIIDRLPFKTPDDPIYAAQVAALEKKQLSAFQVIALPEAALTLKQGVGRLMRSEQDAGLVAIMDNRLLTKNYRSAFWETLPPMTRITTMADARAFWRNNVLTSFPNA